MAFDQALFKAFKDKFAADSTLVGLVNPGSFDRIENRRTHEPELRIDFEMVGPRDYSYANPTGSSGQLGQIKVSLAVVRLHVWAQDSTAFGTGDTNEAAGLIDSITDRLRTVYDNVALTVAGFRTVKMGLGEVSIGAAPAGQVHRIYQQFVLCSSGSTTILTNASALINGFTMPVLRFKIERVECPEPLYDCTPMNSAIPAFGVGEAWARGSAVLMVPPQTSLGLHNANVGMTLITHGVTENAMYIQDTLTIYSWGEYEVAKDGDGQGLPQMLRVNWFATSNSGSSITSGGSDQS